MTGDQLRRLVENIRRDGVLTSLPLVYTPSKELNPDFWAQSKGAPIIVSGNHRVEAAREAGLTEIDVIELRTPVSDARLRAIQLSHNSIGGQDDQSILLELYESLDLDEKLYSGLTDDDFNVEPIDVSGLGIGSVKYAEVTLAFIPMELQEVEQWLQAINDQSRKSVTHVAAYRDFDAFFDAVVKVKTQCKVYNSAIALATMAQLAMERLTQMEQAAQAAANTEGEGDDRTD